jgi:plastocyanin
MKRLLLLVLAGGLIAALAVPAYAATRTVRVDDNVYKPKSLTVKRGDTVRWRWVGEAPHNVVVDRGPQRFRSKLQRRGTYSKKMTRRGSYRIVCTIHPGMTMSLRVR